VRLGLLPESVLILLLVGSIASTEKAPDGIFIWADQVV
jgi:hypothetical protein